MESAYIERYDPAENLMMLMGDFQHLHRELSPIEDEFWDTDVEELEGIGAVKLDPLPKFKEPKFPKVKMPGLPKPPVAFKKIQSVMKGLDNWYKKVTVEEWKYTKYGKTIKANGFATFVFTGGVKLSQWYKRKSCAWHDVKCHYNNIKRIFKGFFHTRGFLIYVTRYAMLLLADGIKLHTKAAKRILENMAALPKQMREYLKKIYNLYADAFKKYVNSVQKEILKMVNKLRESINRAFLEMEKELKKIVDKHIEKLKSEVMKMESGLKERVKALEKSLMERLDSARKAMEADMNKLTEQFAEAKKRFDEGIKVVDSKIAELAKKADVLKMDMDKFSEFMTDANKRLTELEETVRDLTIPAPAPPARPAPTTAPTTVREEPEEEPLFEFSF